jgi:hypothetical protein
MSKNNIKWVSQQKLADDLKISIQRVHNWTKRKKIETYYNNDLKMTLVNPDSVNIKTISQ